MKTIITRQAAKNILNRRYEYHVAGVINGIKDGSEENSYTFDEAVKMITKWLIADVNEFDAGTREGILKQYNVFEIEELVSEWLREGKDLEFFRRRGWISDIKKLENEIKQKEIELNVLKLKCLKAKLLQSKLPDVVFGDIQLMREIIAIWDKR